MSPVARTTGGDAPSGASANGAAGGPHTGRSWWAGAFLGAENRERSADAPPRMIGIDEARAALSGDRPRSCGRLFLSGDTRWEEAAGGVISHDVEVIPLSAVRGIDGPSGDGERQIGPGGKPSGADGIYRQCRATPDTSRLPGGRAAKARGRHQHETPAGPPSFLPEPSNHENVGGPLGP